MALRQAHHMLKNEAPAISAILELSNRRNLIRDCRDEPTRMHFQDKEHFPVDSIANAGLCVNFLRARHVLTRLVRIMHQPA